MCTYQYSKIKKDKLDNFMKIRFEYDSINKSIITAKQLGFTESDCYPLITDKLKILKQYKDLKNELIDLCIQCNLIKFEDSWLGIVCLSKNKKDLLVYPLYDKSIQNIIVDFTHERIQQRDECSKFVNKHINYEKLDEYKNKVLRRRDEILNSFFDCTNSLLKNNKQYMLTSHCIRRWNERIENSNEKVNNENREQIVISLSNSFKKAKLVYSGNVPETNFYLDYDLMIFYAVSKDNIILTLWKNNYGFSSEKINTISTLMQLDCVKHHKVKYKAIESKINEKNNIYKENHQVLCNEIEKTQKYLDELCEKRNHLLSLINENNDILSAAFVELSNEERLLFKPHGQVNIDPKSLENK